MVRIAFLTTGSNALAEELVQDAFAELFRRYDTVQSPDAYLRVAVMSRCTSWVRRRTVARRYEQQAAPASPGRLDPGTIEVMDLIAGLTARQRAAVVLRYFADWPERDIAKALDCRPGTVKSLLSRALAQLAKDLDYDY